MKAPELKEILDQHKLWLETNGVQGQCADLTHANLDSAYLCGADLAGANLQGANLRGANLMGANLTGANLTRANLTRANLIDAKFADADLMGANLMGANLTGANLRGANLSGAYLKGAILPDISWIIPGCLAQLNEVMYGLFYLKKENKFVNFVQDSFGFIIQNNGAEGTFDMLLGDRIIRNIPHWVKYSGLKQIASESV